MKVKTINKNTNQQFDCEEIEIKGYKYYISDEQPLNGEPYYVDNSLGKRIETAETKPSGIIKRIICSTNPNIDIPKVVDEVERLAHKDNPLQKLDGEFLRASFKRGYNKAKETYPFSDEDMIEFLNWIRDNCVFDSAPKPHYRKTQERLTQQELLQLWKEQQIKTVYYEN